MGYLNKETQTLRRVNLKKKGNKKYPNWSKERAKAKNKIQQGLRDIKSFYKKGRWKDMPYSWR